jgi:hypothetical protein
MKHLSVHAGILTLWLAVPALPVRAEAQTIEQLSAAAEKGDADAQYRLAQSYIRGVGILRSFTKAFELIKKAAEQGHPEAIGGVGYFYANGYGVKKDLAAAADWFRKGAEKGGAKAQLNYGLALLNGRGVPADEKEGMKWIDKAVAQGSPHAWFAMAEFYYFGTHGHERSFSKAYEYVQKAAAADLAPAENMLGSMYQEGNGAPIDLAKAEYWFRKAAEQGDPKGMSNLGLLLGPDGPDTSKHVEALKWLLLAQRANEPQASNILNEIFRTRPPEVVKEAQKQMAEFKRRPSTEGKPASEQ